MRYLLIFIPLLFISCNNLNADYKNADNALDAGREFIDACLKGDFSKATFYMLPDETNKKFLDGLEKQYREKGRDGRQQYREASINIAGIDNPTVGITIINYSNSYDKVGHKIKVIQQDNKWLVDLKYTFNPNL